MPSEQTHIDKILEDKTKAHGHKVAEDLVKGAKIEPTPSNPNHDFVSRAAYCLSKAEEFSKLDRATREKLVQGIGTLKFEILEAAFRDGFAVHRKVLLDTSHAESLVLQFFAKHFTVSKD